MLPATAITNERPTALCLFRGSNGFNAKTCHLVKKNYNEARQATRENVRTRMYIGVKIMRLAIGLPIFVTFSDNRLQFFITSADEGHDKRLNFAGQTN